MKNIVYIIFLTALSCTNQTKESDTKTHTDTINQIPLNQKTDNSQYYTTEDTLVIATETADTLIFAKEEFNQIIDNHPEFFYNIAQNPEQLYYCKGDNEELGSEAGQDVYFILYAYFLKQENGINNYANQRNKLIEIYSSINSLFGHFQYGGTYFGHQYKRILGYAEYSVYLYSRSKGDLEKTYDITAQKQLYLNSLRQLIEDEIKIDFNTAGAEKIVRKKELNKIVDGLDKLITDNFYLRRAQEFHYGHYEYY